MSRAAIVLALLVLPTFVLGAGFAKQSIFLSRTNVVEGESVLIHAVVSNDAAAAFKGSLELRDGEDKIGTVPVSLGSGEAVAVSVSWEPAAGKRKVSANLLDQAGAKVESMEETFTIAEKPKPIATSTSQSAAAIESSKNIQNQIGNLSPGVQAATAPVFATLDSVRNSIADTLDAQLKTAKAKLGDVQGAQDEREPGELPETTTGFWFALWTLYFYALTVLRFLIGNAAVFYPVVAIAFLYLLWKVLRRVGGRSR